MSISELQERALRLRANDIRQSIILMLLKAGSGHTAGPLGMTDIFTALYFYILKHDPKNPDMSDRDRLILSNGHICPVLYATLAHAGYIEMGDLDTLRIFGSKLQGHPHREFLPCLETSSGPLGSGLSQTVGMALADRIDHGRNSSIFFYCLTGDGELNEGQNWEAMMLAGKERLQNVIAIVDRNNIQIDGYTEDVMPLDSLRKKIESFQWHVIEIDGHNIEAFVDAVDEAKAIFEKPTCILAHTIPGKGVEFMERDPRWHGVPPGKGPEDHVSSSEQASIALKELRTLQGQIESEHQ